MASSKAQASTSTATDSARVAGLVYVTDGSKGIRRRRAGRGFVYLLPGGKTIRTAHVLERLRKLAIPPAWRDVWICLDPRGHLQATGRDARNRKQYRYHPRWREVRDESKYGTMLSFGSALPTLRRRVAADLASPGLGKDKIVAAVVHLLERTLIRVGNDEYMRANQSFGLTTLRDEHVAISGPKVRFRFTGKSHKTHDVAFQDPRLARVIRSCRDLPGQRLFQFVGEDGRRHDLGSSDVNAYLRSAMGQSFTAKDFRTWTGTVLAARALQSLPRFRSKAEASRNIKTAVTAVAALLNNTPAVCRASYIHPAVTTGYLDGRLFRSSLTSVARGAKKISDFERSEATVLRLLR